MAKTYRVIHFDPVWDPYFPVFKKCQKCKTYIWNAEMTSHCQVSVVGLKSLDVSPCNELLLSPMIIKNSLAWEYFFTHKSTSGVHYRTRSPGQLGLRVAGFPGHWVAGSQNVTQFHLWWARSSRSFLYCDSSPRFPLDSYVTRQDSEIHAPASPRTNAAEIFIRDGNGGGEIIEFGPGQNRRRPADVTQKQGVSPTMTSDRRL